MSSCEKCWADAYMGPYGDQVDKYQRLIKERENNPCTPEEQAGEWWDKEKKIDTRKLKPFLSDIELDDIKAGIPSDA